MDHTMIRLSEKFGNAAGLEGKFPDDYNTDDIVNEILDGKIAQMENAALIDLLTDIGNELFSVDIDGEFCAEHGDGDFKRRLAKRINEAIGL